MATEGSRSSKHRQFRSNLRSFRPAEAAFVLHLCQCEGCRKLAARLLDPEATAPVGDYLGSLSPLERDFILDLTRGGYLLGLVGNARASEDDLPPGELRNFLLSLQPQQSALIRHLLVCQSCRDVAAKTLVPKGGQSLPLNAISPTNLAE